jgi:uncharacterized protein
MSESRPCSAFLDARLIARGSLGEVALAARDAQVSDANVLVFDDATGAVVDLDLRGTSAEILSRLEERAKAENRPGPPCEAESADEAKRRGRPKLGVVAREVTLLPRHWQWLATQSGGASNALRRLVETARRDDGGRDQLRRRREAAYRFMSAMAGNRPGFEEASRSLFAGDKARFLQFAGDWPADIRDHVRTLGFDDAAMPIAKPAGERPSRIATRKEIVARFLCDVWCKGDVGACDTYVADYYTIHHDPGDPWDGRRLDRTEFKERVRLSRAPFPNQRFEIREILADADAVIVAWFWSATHSGELPGFPPTGKPVKMSGATVYYFNDDDRISGHWQIADRLGVLRQLQANSA